MKTRSTKYLLSLLVAFLALVEAKAQVNVEDTASAATLVQNIVGTGIAFSNPVLNCAQGASGQFTVVSSNLGIGDGIILTTGYAKTDPNDPFGHSGANGAQNDYFPANCVGGASDVDLSSLAQNSTFDACILEFDFVPDGDSLLFDYVFGSEEYDSYSCSGFNDVFAFFLSGPGITGNPNIALIPGTSIPVAINSTTNPAVTQPFSTTLCTNMGAGSPFAQYYNDNQFGTSITYYGLTTVMTARAAVIPCTTYHIKLAIADAGDCTLDSGVFLEANSFRSTNIKLELNSSLGADYDYLVEGCTYATIEVKRNTAFPIGQTVFLSYSGTSTRNVDYGAVPDSVIIPPGDTVTAFTIVTLQDALVEGMETITVNVLNPCNHSVIDSIVFPLYDYLPYTLLSDDTLLCGGEKVRLQISGSTDFNWFWRSNPANSNIVDPTKMLTYAYPDTTTTFYVSGAYVNCYTDTQSFVATVEPTPIVNILFPDTLICLGKPLQLLVDVGPSYFTNYTYLWAPNGGLDDAFQRQPNFWVNGAADYKYILAVQTPLGCTGRDSVIISAKPIVELINVTPNFIAKYGEIAQLNADGAETYTWTPDRLLDYPNIKDPKATAVDSALFQVIGMNHWGCRDTAYVKMDIDYTMIEIIPSAFSPNGDGRNDVFKIANAKYQRLAEFRVFNRWGQEVFSTNDINKGWDGTFSGVDQDPGVYQYLIRVTLPDGQLKTYKGDVTLVR